MMDNIVIFFRFLISNFKRILIILAFTIVFLFLLFPLSDLNDLISEQVSKMTQNRVYLQFDQLHLNPITITLGMDNVVIETPQISNLTSENVAISPSVLATLRKKPGGSFVATGFLKGDLEIQISPATVEGVEKSKIDITAQNISLGEARQITQLNIPIKGELNLSSSGLTDLTMAEQPDMDVALTISKFELPSTSISTPMMGALSVPFIRFDKVELKGKLSGGKFVIETGKLGSAKDDFFGEIKGELGFKILNMQGQMIPQLGAYNVTVDLKANPSFQQRAQLFLSFLDGSKKMSGSTAQYKFKVQGDPMGNPLQITPVR